MRKWLVAPLMFALSATAQAEAPPPATLNIAVAADMAHCVEALDAAFSAQHPEVELKVATGASGDFFAQIKNGAPFEVFLSADMDYPRQLVKAGLANAKSLKPYALGRLALWTTTPGINPGRGRTVLTAASTMKIAIANPETSPYGRAAMMAVERLGVADAVKGKLVVGESVAQAAQFVQSGNAEIGFIPYSLLIVPPLKDVGIYILLPGGTYPEILQGAVVTQKGAKNPLAKAYVDFLGSAEARAIFEANGYEAPIGKTPIRRLN
jgi:molybdate transport system substrate-binding protein